MATHDGRRDGPLRRARGSLRRHPAATAAGVLVLLAGAAGWAAVALAGEDGPPQPAGTEAQAPQPPLPRRHPQLAEPQAGLVPGSYPSAPQAPAPRTPAPSASDVRALGAIVAGGAAYLQGDSLMVDTDPFIRALLPGWRIGESARVGRALPEGIRLLRPLAALLPPIVVVGLGTNDEPGSPAAFRAGIDEVMGIAGPGRCVVWVDIFRGSAADPFNPVLRNAQAAHPNLVVAPWASLAAAHPEWFSGDRVHPSSAGSQARARLIVEAMRSCTSL